MATVETQNETKIEIGEELREELIKVAVKFLNNPNVVKTTLTQRKQFLKSKGLSDLEIEEAIKRSTIYHANYSNEIISRAPYVPSPQYVVAQPSLFMRIRDGLQSIAVFSAFIYGVYILYKQYIHPFLFGRGKKKSVGERLEDIDKEMKSAIGELRENIALIHADISTISTQHCENKLTDRHIDDLKSDLATVKGLLLNRKQFPTVANSPVVPPSIPAWQLSSVGASTEGDEPGERDKSEELIEIGSGSGSSETEVVTKNSDSSIEIM